MISMTHAPTLRTTTLINDWLIYQTHFLKTSLGILIDSLSIDFSFIVDILRNILSFLLSDVTFSHRIVADIICYILRIKENWRNWAYSLTSSSRILSKVMISSCFRNELWSNLCLNWNLNCLNDWNTDKIVSKPLNWLTYWSIVDDWLIMRNFLVIIYWNVVVSHHKGWRSWTTNSILK